MQEAVIDRRDRDELCRAPVQIGEGQRRLGVVTIHVACTADVDLGHEVDRAPVGSAGVNAVDDDLNLIGDSRVRRLRQADAVLVGRGRALDHIDRAVVDGFDNYHRRVVVIEVDRAVLEERAVVSRLDVVVTRFHAPGTEFRRSIGGPEGQRVASDLEASAVKLHAVYFDDDRLRHVGPVGQ